MYSSAKLLNSLYIKGHTYKGKYFEVMKKPEFHLNRLIFLKTGFFKDFGQVFLKAASCT